MKSKFISLVLYSALGLPIVFSLIALFPITYYPFYMGVRWVMFLSSIVILTKEVRRGNIWGAPFVFLPLIVLFNPFFIIHQNRQFWGIVNSISVITFGYFLFSYITRPPKLK